jgi:hypothetical protein
MRRRERPLAGHLLPCLLILGLAIWTLAARRALDERTAASGLQEALSVGAGRASGLLGQRDGYLGNLEVRIPMPERIKSVDKTLRTVGRADLVDEFVVGMNRAAEAAAPLAKPILIDAIQRLTFQDALRILRGKDHEATDYLRASAGPDLAVAFRPIVKEKFDAVGATRSFDRLMRRYGAVPLTRRPPFDLQEYVTGKALDGLFLMIAREEERIRKDPVARTTALLKRVFGGL